MREEGRGKKDEVRGRGKGMLKADDSIQHATKVNLGSSRSFIGRKIVSSVATAAHHTRLIQVAAAIPPPSVVSFHSPVHPFVH